MNSPKEIIEYAKKIGLNGIAITDHNTIDGTLEALKIKEENKDDPFLIIPGIEISSKDGHIIALNVKENIRRDMTAKETVKVIHDLGGLAIAAHPYDFFRRGVGDLIFDIEFDAIEIENGHTLYTYKNLLKMMKNEGRNLTLIGGSDAHCLDEIGSVTIKIKENYKNPIEAIKKNDVFVVKNISKIKILKNFMIRKVRKKIFRYYK